MALGFREDVYELVVVISESMSIHIKSCDFTIYMPMHALVLYLRSYNSDPYISSSKERRNKTVHLASLHKLIEQGNLEVCPLISQTTLGFIYRVHI